MKWTTDTRQEPDAPFDYEREDAEEQAYSMGVEDARQGLPCMPEQVCDEMAAEYVKGYERGKRRRSAA